MTEQEFCSRIWNYYLMLESDFIGTLSYVELADENNSTYSNEYVKLLLAICSEIDVVCKVFCSMVDPTCGADNITIYRKTLMKMIPDIKKTKTVCIRSQDFYTPFESWGEDRSPDWWVAYNSVKHGGLMKEGYKKGNQKNVYNSLCGLFLLCRFLYLRIAAYEPDPASRLLLVDGWPQYLRIGGKMVIRTTETGFMIM